MKAIDMNTNTPYRAITNSSDGTIVVGQIMWLSGNGQLNLATEDGGGSLLEDEWKSSETGDFDVEETSDFYIRLERWSESLCRK